MPLAILQVNLECESIAWLSGDERARSSARRRPGPAFSWFDTRSLVGRPQTKVDFVGRLALERGVRTVFVVPSKIGLELPAKRGAALRNDNPARRLVVHGPDEAFDYCDASVLPDRVVPNTDRLALAPAFEGVAAENTAFVAD